MTGQHCCVCTDCQCVCHDRPSPDAEQLAADHLQQRNQLLAAEVHRLRAALEPFAQQALIIDANDKADGYDPAETFALFKFRGSYTAICIGDCRRAAQALDRP